MTFFKEFKAFATRGNVIDMAVGIIIGASFTKIVSTLVDGILMPPIGVLVGGVDFSHLAWTIKQATETTKAVTINYGLFISTVIDFLIVAFVIFVLIKGINKLHQKKEAAPTEKLCPECCMVIPINAKRCGHCSSLCE